MPVFSKKIAFMCEVCAGSCLAECVATASIVQKMAQHNRMPSAEYVFVRVFAVGVLSSFSLIFTTYFKHIFNIFLTILNFLPKLLVHQVPVIRIVIILIVVVTWT